MKAMILAAGKGTRVQPITHDIPKPMVPIVKKPVMESILQLLSQHGVDEVVINTSHLASSIENYFRDGSQFGMNIAYSFEGKIVDGVCKGEALGSAGGLKKIQNFSGFFDDTFIVLCGDALIDLDISAALEFHKNTRSMATIVLKDVARNEVSKYGVVQTDTNGRIVQFQEKPDTEMAISTTVNTGIYIFEPEILDYIPDNVDYDIGGDLFPRLVEESVPFYGVSMPFQWIDIGSIPDYWNANKLALNGQINNFKLPGKEIAPGIRVGVNVDIDLCAVDIKPPVYIASGSAIEDGATVHGPTVIGANCVVEAGATVEQCLVDDYTRVTRAACLKRKIVMNGRCIQPEGNFLSIEDTELNWVIDDVRKDIRYSEIQDYLYALSFKQVTPSQTL